jgi:DNA-binding response OmpR family regulator
MNGAPDIETAKPRILIVEDQTATALLMVCLLTQAGCDVEAAWNAQTGIEKAWAEDFDLITLEVDLPGVNGFEMCRRLKENPRSFDTPVIFVSWRDSIEDQQQGLGLGAADYITKPFNPMDFASRVLSCIRPPQNPSDFPDEDAHTNTQSLGNAP